MFVSWGPLAPHPPLAVFRTPPDVSISDAAPPFSRWASSIGPGHTRGNHRHAAKNESILLFGGAVLFRLETHGGPGYVDFTLLRSQRAVFALPVGVAHAITSLEVCGEERRQCRYIGFLLCSLICGGVCAASSQPTA